MHHISSVGWDSQAASIAIFFLPLASLCGTFHTSFAVFNVSSLSSALVFPRSWGGESFNINRNHTKIQAHLCNDVHTCTQDNHGCAQVYSYVWLHTHMYRLYVYTQSFLGVRCLALVNCVIEKQIFKLINNDLLRQSIQLIFDHFPELFPPAVTVIQFHVLYLY